MFAGIDVGSRVTKAVILDGDKICGYALEDNIPQPPASAQSALKKALAASKVEYKKLLCIVGTGYGRESLDFVHARRTELYCDACGINFICPEARTIIDIGAQDSKVIKIDDTGAMLDFVLNDKCAAGTGRFLEVMAGAIGLSVDKLGEYSLRSKKPCLVNNTCTVFAETEVISLLSTGNTAEDIAAGVHKAIASRVGNSVMKLGAQSAVVFAGGVAKNQGVKAALEQLIGVKFTPLSIDPQFAGALGAARMAYKLFKKENA